MASDLKVAYNSVFNSEAGQLVLEDIMSYCHFLEPIEDNFEFKEGRRDVALFILQRMKIDFKGVSKQIDEMVDG